MQDQNFEPSRSEAEARLVAIIESSDDAIVSKTLEGIVTSWNKSAERIFGWTSAEMIGTPINIIIPADRAAEEPHILQRIRSGERVDHFETIRQTKDGRLIHVSVTISPVRDPSGRVIGVSKVARDITQQKQFQQELQAAKDEAEAANRAKDHFLSVLSHELRTPLTPVLVAVDLLERSGAQTAESAAHLAMIRRNVETEARLVDDLLDVTRIARGKVTLHHEIVDVHAALRNVLGMLESGIEEKGLTTAVSLRARECHVWADAGRFQQILLNLLSNAVKFTPTDGTITVRTSSADGTINVDIADTGIGIDPAALPRLFEPFEQGEQTVTRRFGGLGLGLSIVRSLADMHKAIVTATSEGPDRGTTFTLQMAAVSPTLAPPRKPTADGAGARPRRILLVEDHADTRQMMSMLMASFGCTVTSAGSVREAVEAADRGTFDLLVSDIGLPDGSGLDVMRHVSQKFQLKGIALSGFGQDEDLRKSREAGFVTHLTKPVNVQMLQDVIERVAS